ncbi:MAG: 16S rRNA (cytosine(967)-C(5))-methyltransferase RsmB [Methylococcaceae bacterium]
MNTRKLAAQVLVKVIADGQSLTSALAQLLPTLKDPKEQSFVQALCYGVCRHYQRLDFILSLLLDKPLKDKDLEIKLLALLGLYQLSLMRVKDHAAVSETVQAAKKTPWAKSLLNALLRRYLRESEVLEARADNHKIAHLSHPQWLIERIENDWSEQADAILKANNEAPPLVLRLNIHKISREDYLLKLAEFNINATALKHCPSAIQLEKPVAVTSLPYFSEGLISVQDSAAQLAAELLDLQAGQRVLDLCAAPGGKTTHILEYQTDLKEVVAIDNDDNRMQRVRENLQRLKLTATLITADAVQINEWWDGQLFERILVDAPCSALGVIRRHPDIKLLRRADDIDALAQLQKQILTAAWQLLKPNGILVYASCSVLKQENEAQIAEFLNENSDAVELEIIADWGIARPHGRQILTGSLNQDGFYYAKLQKQG